MLETLDRLEGNPIIYKRRLEPVKPIDGQEEVLTAWIYAFQRFNEKLLKETFYDSYKCNNYDLLRSLSGKATPEEREVFLRELRSEVEVKQ